MTKKDIDALFIPESIAEESYRAPETVYCKTKESFDQSVSEDFIKHANAVTSTGKHFIVGLSHGQSPAGAYTYIIDHYRRLKHPEKILYTFVHSKLKSQRELTKVIDASAFLKRLLKRGYIQKDQILGHAFDRENLEDYKDSLNATLHRVMNEEQKKGLDYIFLSIDPKGRVAGITRNSSAFGSDAISEVVHDRSDRELTLTPKFISKAQRIAFLATKAEKRRPLAWLFYRWGKPDECPSFLRFIENVEARMSVYVDDAALTWPQIVVERETPYGISNIRVDLARDYNPNTKSKRPVVLMVHGFLGLNTFDGLLAAIPTRKYIAAAMHYGSIPSDMPIDDYSEFVVKNIDAVIEYFGSKGHPVYLFDHSMANMYFLISDQQFHHLNGVKKYLRGRIGANPFFGKEAKHAMIGFLDNVILKSKLGITERAVFLALRTAIPVDTKYGVRRRAIRLNRWLIQSDSSIRVRIWKSVKERILFLMTHLDTLPHLNRIPVKKALNRLPVKIFAIQVYSALKASIVFDSNIELVNMPQANIPILILKSRNDVVAKFVPRIYENSENVEIVDITNEEEKSLFREHLFHMVNPQSTTRIIDRFISDTEEMHQRKAQQEKEQKSLS